MMDTQNLFLDTQVFTGEMFDFGSKKLTEIRRLAQDGKLKVLITETTVDECKKRIEKMVAHSISELRGKESKGVLKLAPSFDRSFFDKLDEKVLSAEIIAKFEQFLKETKATVCPLAITIKELFADYHDGKPPFGPEQKKDQFPDAAAMLSLLKWCKANKEKANVVSNDGDLSSVCEANPKVFTYYKGLGGFLDAFNKHQALAQVVESIVAKQESVIKMEVARKFEASGFILTGEDGEVEHVKVDEIEFGKSLIVALHDDYALVELTVNVDYTAQVSYEDSSTGYRDHEDDKYYFRETVNEEVERNERVSIELEIEFKADSPDDARVSVHFGNGDFRVKVGENPLDYK